MRCFGLGIRVYWTPTSAGTLVYSGAKLLECIGAGAQFAGRVCAQIELGEFEGSLLSPTEHPVRQVDLVDKSGGQGGLAEEHLGQPDRLLISRLRETQLHDCQGRVR